MENVGLVFALSHPVPHTERGKTVTAPCLEHKAHSQSSGDSVANSLPLAIHEGRAVQPPRTRTQVANCVDANANGY